VRTTNGRKWLEGKRGRGYLRVSSKGQADKYGPAAQRRDEVEAATAHGVGELEHFYEDHITGTNAYKRQDFQRMVADARTKRFDVLVVGRVDRFARNERDAWNYLHELAETGVAVYFCEEDVLVPHDQDWQDEIGTEINGAAAYVRKLRRNVTKGLRSKWAAGGHVGGVPFGYRRTADKLRLEPNDEISVRKLAFELYATGKYSMASLAEELNRRGHKIEGRPFRIRAIESILRNPIVVGKVRWHIGRLDEAERMDLCDPVIATSLWDRVQQLLETRGTRRSRRSRRHYVFSGVARCASCGERLWGDYASSGAKPNGEGRWHYRRLVHSPRGCRRGTWSEAKLERLIGTWLDGWRLPADAKVKIVKYLSGHAADDGDRAARRRQLDGELARVTNLYRWEHIGEAEYLAERRRIQRALDAVPQPITTGPSEEALRLVGQVGEIWRRNEEDWRRRFIDEWFEEIRISPRAEQLELVVRAPYRELVYASVSVPFALIKRSRRDANPPTPAVTVRGLEQWTSYWTTEASA
jgi:DNA invertase Pin-like site-specific DNA recombinase